MKPFLGLLVIFPHCSISSSRSLLNRQTLPTAMPAGGAAGGAAPVQAGEVIQAMFGTRFSSHRINSGHEPGDTTTDLDSIIKQVTAR